MPNSQSTRQKPAKPSPAFPPVCPRLRQVGQEDSRQDLLLRILDSPDDVLAEYQLVEDDLEGRDPWTIDPESFTVADVCNHNLTAMDSRVGRDDLSARTFADYRIACELMTKLLGRNSVVVKLGPDQFRAAINSIAERRNPFGTGNEVTRFTAAEVRPPG